jgi:hypothetical protein
MGDIADWLVDNMLDEYEDAPDGYYADNVTCRYCGTGGLEWAFTGKRWVLMNDDGEIHVCNRTASPDDFEDIS